MTKYFKKKLLGALVVIPFVLFFELTTVVQIVKHITPDNLSFYDNLTSMLFNRTTMVDRQLNIANSMFGVFLTVLCNFMYGNYICKNLSVGGTYYFVRQMNRKKWLLQQVAGFSVIIFLFSLCQVFTAWILAVLITRQPINRFAILLGVVDFGAIFIYNLFTTLVINYLSLWLGNLISFIVVYMSMALSFVLSFCLWKGTFGIAPYPATYFFPTEITSMVADDSDVYSIKQLIVLNKNTFGAMCVSIGYIIICTLLMLLVVDKIDYTIEDKELNGY